MIERDLLGWDLDDVLEGYEVDFTVDVCSVQLDREAREKLDAEPAIGAMTARGRCRCSHEAGDSDCDVHPTCEGCGRDLAPLVAYTSPPWKRLCAGCYHAKNGQAA